MKVKAILKRWLPEGILQTLIQIHNWSKGCFVRVAIHRASASHLIRRYRIERWLSKNSNPRLQVGGGKHLIKSSNWINGDIIAGDIYLDATKEMPIRSESLEVVFSEQFIEHIPLDDALFFLSEARRVLRPGGVLRISTPDLDKLMALHTGQNPWCTATAAYARHQKVHGRPHKANVKKSVFLINDFFRLWGHSFIYDKSSIKSLLEQVGFKTIKFVACGQSSHSFLRNLERHFEEPWQAEGLSLFVEAVK